MIIMFLLKIHASMWKKTEKWTGYELQTNITYYRGIPMSMIEYIKVAADGEEAPTPRYSHFY